MSPHSDTLSRFRANQSLLFLLNAACLAEKQQIQIFIVFGTVSCQIVSVSDPRQCRFCIRPTTLSLLCQTHDSVAFVSDAQDSIVSVSDPQHCRFGVRWPRTVSFLCQTHDIVAFVSDGPGQYGFCVGPTTLSLLCQMARDSMVSVSDLLHCRFCVRWPRTVSFLCQTHDIVTFVSDGPGQYRFCVRPTTLLLLCQMALGSIISMSDPRHCRFCVRWPRTVSFLCQTHDIVTFVSDGP